MHIPQTNPLPSLGPVSSSTIVIHKLAGLSWHVLMPYTLLGAGLMVYSQVRFMRGQRLHNQQVSALASKPKRPGRPGRTRTTNGFKTILTPSVRGTSRA
jgi:hypothetical protein